MKTKINKKLIQESLLAKAKIAGAVGAGLGGLELAHQLNTNKLSDNISNNISNLKNHSTQPHEDIISSNHFEF